MRTGPDTAFATVLAAPEHQESADFLAASWFDQTVQLRLGGVGSSCPSDIGGHVRRSFLGALSPGASEAARARAPCTWDPPCALDVFCREQLRGAKGDGMPKPFIIQTQVDAADLLVSLRVFGMANDWFMCAVEALSTGLSTILPWSRLYPGRTEPPPVRARHITTSPPLTRPPTSAVVLDFVSPADISGKDFHGAPHTLLTRMLRRVDAVSRWNGLALSDGVAQDLARQAHAFSYDISGLRSGIYKKPNAAGQKRHNQTVQGKVQIIGDLEAFWPILLIAERAHTGRGAVEGLGQFVLLQN